MNPFVAFGNDELNLAQGIQERTGAQSIVGKASLAELLGWVAGARAVVTNDTMAAHLSASYDRPTVIVANGINYMRFSEYANIGATQVATIYPEVVMRRRERQGDGLYPYSETVSADIISIQATTVMQVLSDLLAASEKQFETAPQG